tara:strand:+ start:498 stop:716 length:219 start_codon:yes stop_codon:yes gene_type:complete
MTLENFEKEALKQIEQLTSLKESGDITVEEFKELVEDIADVSKIESDLSLEDNKIKAEKIIDAIKAIAGLIS